MNQIQANFEKSKYSNEAHLTINVDGISLDKILHDLYPDLDLLGLVPTLLDWLEDLRERKLVWDRLESNQKQVVPILMCPDDVDLWCTLVSVEIEKTENSVKWSRIGLDRSTYKFGPSEPFVSNVKWFDKIEPLEFDRTQYLTFLSKFKAEIEKDEVKRRIQFWLDRIDERERIPSSIKAFNIGVIETEDDYQTYLVGAINYQAENDDWACTEDFRPREKYLSLGEDSKKWTRKEIGCIVKTGVEEFIQYRIAPLTFVHKAEYLTTGFDEADLKRVNQKLHSDSVKKMASDLQRSGTIPKANFWSKLKSIWS